MADKPFVINDRRKFTAEGELRPDAPPSEPKPIRDDSPIESSAAHAVESTGPKLVETPAPAEAEATSEEQAPSLTAEQTQQASSAYDATVDRLDTAIRAQNLGAEQPPPVTFSAVIQTLFMQAIVLLGGAAEPGQPVSVDPMGARQIIDMIAVVVDKARGNLTPDEDKFCQSALFELRMGFLEITQRLARQAAAKSAGMPGTPGGPNLVR